MQESIVFIGHPKPANNNHRRMRFEDVDFKILCHEHYIKSMLDLAGDCKDSQQRLRIAQEIGYSRIEIECHLKPLRERL